MSTVQHTPTPWHAILHEGGASEITTDPDLNKATVLFSRYSFEERKHEMHANADFIVKAVNSHDELVKRLSWAVQFIETYARKASMPATPEINKCKEALKAAKKE